jgi:pimeloyl-ACP methyl ester carboxylesterase
VTAVDRIVPSRPSGGAITTVLVHGAGHTSAVWAATRAAFAGPTLAVDLPGRGVRPADLTRVTVDEAADAVAADVRAAVEGDVVLVGHSVAGTVLPSVAARLGDRVRALVFVAGISAPEGQPPTELFLPGQAELVATRLAELRAEHGGRSLEALDVKTASSIDSLNLSSQPMRWAGIADSMPRTFVRCLRDPIQNRDLQDRFIASCGADHVVDIDTGHTPAMEDPLALASVLEAIVTAIERAAPGS